MANPWTVGAGAEPEDDKWAIAKTAINKPISVEELIDDEAAKAAEDAAKAAANAAKAAADAAEEAAKAAADAAKDGDAPPPTDPAVSDPTVVPTVVAGDSPTVDPAVAVPALPAVAEAAPVAAPAPAAAQVAASVAPVEVWTGADVTLQSGPRFEASAALVSHLTYCVLHIFELLVTC